MKVAHVLLVVAATPVSGWWWDSAATEVDPGCQKETGLRGWLCKLSFSVPHEEFDVGDGEEAFHIILYGLACRNLQLGQVTTRVVSAPTDATYRLAIGGIGVDCKTNNTGPDHAGFDFKQKRFPYLGGHGTADVTLSGVSINSGIVLTIDPRNHTATAAAQAPDAKMSIDKIDITLHGS